MACLQSYRPASEHPAAPGVYATNRGGYRYFDNGAWYWGGSTHTAAKNACRDPKHRVPSECVYPWRQLTEDDPR